MSAAARLPPLGLQIVYVNMTALPNVRDDAANVMSILQDGVANFEVTEGNLVAERHGIERLEADGLVGFHDPTGDFFAGLDVFDNYDANGVGFVVHDEISGHEVVFPPTADLRVVNLI
jgi:hypothetical protein